jgi:hypothetical protein
MPTVYHHLSPSVNVFHDSDRTFAARTSVAYPAPYSISWCTLLCDVLQALSTGHLTILKSIPAHKVESIPVCQLGLA